ncbi:MAG: CRTAC1 family protein [Deltaproteobacteria bacterium]|nr:CRTAC1 family protein [Deltaproteobacteria bacterium]
MTTRFTVVLGVMAMLAWTVQACDCGGGSAEAGDARAGGGAGAPDTGALDGGVDGAVDAGADGGVDTDAGADGGDAGTAGSCAPVVCLDPPALMPGPAGDPVQDASGATQRFERITITGLPYLKPLGTGGAAIADVNGDGLVDVFLQEDTGQQNDAGRLFLNRGCFGFEYHPLKISANLPADSHAIPVFADFNGDGLLDLFITRYVQPTSLLMADGAFDEFRDVAPALGVTNVGSWNRQAQIADLNGDGWLDIAVAADQISSMNHRPLHRLFIYVPAPSGEFEDGHFEDAGGTSLAPGFGGSSPSVCDPGKDRAGPSILLRDIDDDGDVDLVQAYHNDLTFLGEENAENPCAPGEWKYGVFAWRNTLVESGQFGFEPVPAGPGGASDDSDDDLPEVGQAAWGGPLQGYQHQGNAVSLPYLNSADVDNDGDLDIIVVGPTDPDWHLNSSMTAGKFWRNDGQWRFPAATGSAGLEALNWTYDQWSHFFGFQMPQQSDALTEVCEESAYPDGCRGMRVGEHQFYGADTVFGDFDNDGWLDLIYVDRHEPEKAELFLRNVFFHNNGDGTFTPEATELSGIDANSIAAEAADLNGDGLLDLILLADPDNSTGGLVEPGPDRKLDKVYWNTGRQGGAGRHWVRIRLAGKADAQLIGSRIFAQRSGTTACTGSGEQRTCIGRRDYYPVGSYKSSQGLEAHFGLGSAAEIDVRVELPNGAQRVFHGVPIDGLVVLDVTAGTATCRY